MISESESTTPASGNLSPKEPIQSPYDAVISSLSDDPTHPVQVAIRTYALSLVLSLGPALVPFVTPLLRATATRGIIKNRTGPRLVDVLRHELGFKGFAFAFTAASAGGAAVRRLWCSLEEAGERLSGLHSDIEPIALLRLWSKCKRRIASRKFTPLQKSFLSNFIASSFAAVLLRVGRRSFKPLRIPLPIPWTLPITGSSPSSTASLTLDLTLLLCVRAFDSAVQWFVFENSKNVVRNSSTNASVEGNILRVTLEREKRIQEANKRRRYLTTAIDAFVFWGCSARCVHSTLRLFSNLDGDRRIMWCFFYEPQRSSSFR